MMEIKFQGRLTGYDYHRLSWAMLVKSPLSLLKTLIFLLIFETLMAMIYIVLAAPSWKILMIIFVVLFLFGLLKTDVYIRRSYDKNPVLQESRTGQATEEGIFNAGSTFEARIRWEGYSKHFIQPERVALFRFPAWYIFTRNLFSSDADWNAFVELVKAKVPAR